MDWFVKKQTPLRVRQRIHVQGHQHGADGAPLDGNAESRRPHDRVAWVLRHIWRLEGRKCSPREHVGRQDFGVLTRVVEASSVPNAHAAQELDGRGVSRHQLAGRRKQCLGFELADSR